MLYRKDRNVQKFVKLIKVEEKVPKQRNLCKFECGNMQRASNLYRRCFDSMIH